MISVFGNKAKERTWKRMLKKKHAEFSEKRTFLTPWCAREYRAKKCLFFGKFGVTPVFRFALLLYYRRFVVRLLTPVKIWSLEDHWNSLLHSALRPKPCLLFFSNLKLFNFGHFHYSVKHQLGYIILWILCVNFCVVCSFLVWLTNYQLKNYPIYSLFFSFSCTHFIHHVSRYCVQRSTFDWVNNLLWLLNPTILQCYTILRGDFSIVGYTSIRDWDYCFMHFFFVSFQMDLINQSLFWISKFK